MTDIRNNRKNKHLLIVFLMSFVCIRQMTAKSIINACSI